MADISLPKMQSLNIQIIPDTLYKEIIASIPIACVDVVIIHQGSFLLVKRNDPPAKGQWWLPGGRIYKGEMMRAAARRKALEEVGIECNIGPIVHVAETIFPDGPNGIPIHSINSCFLLYPIDKVEVRLDSHHSDFVWKNSLQILLNYSDNFHPYIIKCLEGAGFNR